MKQLVFETKLFWFKRKPNAIIEMWKVTSYFSDGSTEEHDVPGKIIMLQPLDLGPDISHADWSALKRKKDVCRKDKNTNGFWTTLTNIFKSVIEFVGLGSVKAKQSCTPIRSISKPQSSTDVKR